MGNTAVETLSKAASIPAPYEDRARHLLKTLLELLVHGSPLSAAGIAIVEQEGERAGLVRIHHISRSDIHQNSIAILEQTLNENLLAGGLPLPMTPNPDIQIMQLGGQFGVTIGYLWVIPINNDDSTDRVRGVADGILQFVEYSKKSRFHEVFSHFIPDRASFSDAYKLIDVALRQGLYCDCVVIWEKVGGLLHSRNLANLDVPVAKSLAGRAAQGGPIVVHDINDGYTDIVFHKEFFSKRGLRSAFFLPLARPSSSNVVGVCGVFYKRPNGTTIVDQQLCQYVINYYQSIWGLLADVDDTRKQLSEISDARDFFKDAVRCLIDFHDITSIQMGLASSISDALSYSHRNPDAERVLKEGTKELRKLKELTDKHSSSLKIAKNYAEILVGEEAETPILINVHDLFFSELHSVEKQLVDAKIRLKPSYNLPKNSYRIRKSHLQKILRNLISNAIRAFWDKTYGSREIRVSMFLRGPRQLVLKVRDTGVGIPSDKMDAIFEPLVTTNAGRGGKGLGLAIVKAISNQYGRSPVVESKWGEFSEFEVSIDYYL